jgi:predicted metal-binding membrane protein
LIFGRVREKRKVAGQIFAPTGAFVAGYLLVWAGFSLLATTANWLLHTGGLMSSIMGNVGSQAGGLLIVAAGVFQWTPLKNACLDHCRSPMSFLMQHWREGNSGAVLMGLHHGIYCLGCCWLLMLLLFALGVMNLLWVALLAIVALVEKILPRGEILSRVLGGLLIGWGAWLIITG